MTRIGRNHFSEFDFRLCKVGWVLHKIRDSEIGAYIRVFAYRESLSVILSSFIKSCPVLFREAEVELRITERNQHLKILLIQRVGTRQNANSFRDDVLILLHRAVAI